MAKGSGTGRIPRYLDAPITILIWDADVFIPAALLFVIGIFTRNFLLCSSVAVAYLYVMAKCQNSLPRGMVGNVLHRFGLCGIPGRGDPAVQGVAHGFQDIQR